MSKDKEELKAELNITVYPSSDSVKQDPHLLAIGDLHANPMKLIYFALKGNVISLPQEVYDRLYQIYKNHYEFSQLRQRVHPSELDAKKQAEKQQEDQKEGLKQKPVEAPKFTESQEALKNEFEKYEAGEITPEEKKQLQKQTKIDEGQSLEVYHKVALIQTRLMKIFAGPGNLSPVGPLSQEQVDFLNERSPEDGPWEVGVEATEAQKHMFDIFAQTRQSIMNECCPKPPKSPGTLNDKQKEFLDRWLPDGKWSTSQPLTPAQVGLINDLSMPRSKLNSDQLKFLEAVLPSAGPWTPDASLTSQQVLAMRNLLKETNDLFDPLHALNMNSSDSPIVLRKKYEDGWPKIIEEYQEFIALIKTIAKSPNLDPEVLVRLIGDVICDRGANDLLVLELLDVLDDLGIPYDALLGNHDIFFVRLVEQAFSEEAKGAVNVFDAGGGQANSTQMLLEFIQRGVVTKERVTELYQKAYRRHLKAIGFSLAEEGKLIGTYTHAPMPKGLLPALARRLGVEYQDHTPTHKALSIERMNKKFQEYLEQGRVHELYEDIIKAGKSVEPKELTPEELKEAIHDNPFTVLMWVRKNEDNKALFKREGPEEDRPTEMEYHGHDKASGEESYRVNLDDRFGMKDITKATGKTPAMEVDGTTVVNLQKAAEVFRENLMEATQQFYEKFSPTFPTELERENAGIYYEVFYQLLTLDNYEEGLQNALAYATDVINDTETPETTRRLFEGLQRAVESDLRGLNQPASSQVAQALEQQRQELSEGKRKLNDLKGLQEVLQKESVGAKRSARLDIFEPGRGMHGTGAAADLTDEMKLVNQSIEDAQANRFATSQETESTQAKITAFQASLNEAYQAELDQYVEIMLPALKSFQDRYAKQEALLNVMHEHDPLQHEEKSTVIAEEIDQFNQIYNEETLRQNPKAALLAAKEHLEQRLASPDLTSPAARDMLEGLQTFVIYQLKAFGEKVQPSPSDQLTTELEKKLDGYSQNLGRRYQDLKSKNPKKEYSEGLRDLRDGFQKAIGKVHRELFANGTSFQAAQKAAIAELDSVGSKVKRTIFFKTAKHALYSIGKAAKSEFFTQKAAYTEAKLNALRNIQKDIAGSKSAIEESPRPRGK